MACGQQKVKGGNGSNIASSSASCSASCSASIITLNLGVGCAPSCWPIFGFRNLLGARRGAEGSFLCSPSSRFSGRGGGVGSPPGRGGELGCQARQVLKKIVRLHRFFLHQISLESKLDGRQKVKGGHGSNIASSSASSSASSITLNLGVGCAPSCWPIFGFRNLLGARRGLRGQFSVQSE